MSFVFVFFVCEGEFIFGYGRLKIWFKRGKTEDLGEYSRKIWDRRWD